MNVTDIALSGLLWVIAAVLVTGLWTMILLMILDFWKERREDRKKRND